MFGAGIILARSARPAPNMGVATKGSEAAKCVLWPAKEVSVYCSGFLYSGIWGAFFDETVS